MVGVLFASVRTRDHQGSICKNKFLPQVVYQISDFQTDQKCKKLLYGGTQVVSYNHLCIKCLNEVEGSVVNFFFFL